MNGKLEKTAATDPIILVVDDIQKNIQVVGGILNDAGFEVMPATSGAQAFERIRTQMPDWVRPARPARWSADAALIFSTRSVLMPRCGSKRAMRARPESTTAVTPSIVSDVSATFVETIIFRWPYFSTARS